MSEEKKEAYKQILRFIEDAPDEWTGDQLVDGIVELCEREIAVVE